MTYLCLGTRRTQRAFLAFGFEIGQRASGIEGGTIGDIGGLGGVGAGDVQGTADGRRSGVLLREKTQSAQGGRPRGGHDEMEDVWERVGNMERG